MKLWRRKNRYETRTQQSARSDDLRRKEIAGAWLLDANLPHVRSDQKEKFGDAIASMIARQTHKDVDTRQYEIELFQPYFGLEWVKRWQRIIDRNAPRDQPPQSPST